MRLFNLTQFIIILIYTVFYFFYEIREIDFIMLLVFSIFIQFSIALYNLIMSSQEEIDSTLFNNNLTFKQNKSLFKFELYRKTEVPISYKKVFSILVYYKQYVLSIISFLLILIISIISLFTVVESKSLSILILIITFSIIFILKDIQITVRLFQINKINKLISKKEFEDNKAYQEYINILFCCRDCNHLFREYQIQFYKTFHGIESYTKKCIYCNSHNLTYNPNFKLKFKNLKDSITLSEASIYLENSFEAPIILFDNYEYSKENYKELLNEILEEEKIKTYYKILNSKEGE